MESLRNRGNNGSNGGTEKSQLPDSVKGHREAPVKRRSIIETAVMAFLAVCLLVGLLFPWLQKSAALFATAAALFYVRNKFLAIPGRPSRLPARATRFFSGAARNR